MVSSRLYLSLKRRGKLSHLTGKGLSSTDPRFRAWDEENAMIMSWLWNSMLLEISRNCMFLSSAHDIWETLRKSYSMKQDAAVIYELRTKAAAMK